MPWTEKQHKLFEAAAHNPSIAKKKGIPQAKAKEMADEGVKKKNEREKTYKNIKKHF